MDDVFFSYITGVLEELGSPESSEEAFDMDTFVEMMEAYIPGFAEIHRYAIVTGLYVHAMHQGPDPKPLSTTNSFVVFSWKCISTKPEPS